MIFLPKMAKINLMILLDHLKELTLSFQKNIKSLKLDTPNKSYVWPFKDPQYILHWHTLCTLYYESTNFYGATKILRGFTAPWTPLDLNFVMWSLILQRPSEAVFLEHLHEGLESIPEIMWRVTAAHKIPLQAQMQLLTRVRLAKNFPNFEQRLKCILARLQALSILGEPVYYWKLQSGSQYDTAQKHWGYTWNSTFAFPLVYSVGPAEIVDPLIYDGFVEELVEVLESKEKGLMVSY